MAKLMSTAKESQRLKYSTTRAREAPADQTAIDLAQSCAPNQPRPATVNPTAASTARAMAIVLGVVLSAPSRLMIQEWLGLNGPPSPFGGSSQTSKCARPWAMKKRPTNERGMFHPPRARSLRFPLNLQFVIV